MYIENMTAASSNTTTRKATSGEITLACIIYALHAFSALSGVLPMPVQE